VVIRALAFSVFFAGRQFLLDRPKKPETISARGRSGGLEKQESKRIEHASRSWHSHCCFTGRHPARDFPQPARFPMATKKAVLPRTRFSRAWLFAGAIGVLIAAPAAAATPRDEIQSS